MFSQFNNCKFERCAYTHDQDVKNNSNIDELNNEIVELKKSVDKLSESHIAVQSDLIGRAVHPSILGPKITNKYAIINMQ